MVRIAMAAAAFLAALTFGPLPASANEGPWCAVISIGQGDIVWDCHYRSVEECRPNVLAGNRGTCNQNPRWEGRYVPAEARKTRKKRHAG